MENDSTTSDIFSQSTGTTATPENTYLDDLIVVTIWTIILIYAFITNTLTLIGICRSRKMRQATSYWIVASLAICDWLMILVSLGHIIPATYFHENFVDISSTRNILAMFIYNVFWYSGVIQLAAMAVNRFVSIVFPLQYKLIFAPKNTLLILVALYLLGLLASVPALFDCCYVLYDHYNYVTYYSPLDSSYMWLDILINTLSVTTMIICYTAIMITVRRSSIRRRRYQLAAKTGTASKTVLLIATATATSSCCTSNIATTTMTPLLTGNKDNTRKESFRSDWEIIKAKMRATLPFHKTDDKNAAIDGGTDQRKSISIDQKSQSFREYKTESANDQRLSIDAKRLSIGDRRRSTTLPNLFAVNTNNNDTSKPKLSTNVIYNQKHCAALVALQQRHTDPTQPTRREVKLFVQFFVVSLVFLSTWVTWQWLPRIPNASKWIYFATTTFFFINNAINPTVYLIFNTGLRHEVKDVLYCYWARKFSNAGSGKSNKLKSEQVSNAGARSPGKNSSSSD